MKKKVLFLGGLLASTMAMAGTTLWEQGGEHAGAYFGFGACGGFDFDNDGFSDVLVASPDYTENGSQWAGKVYVWSGADQSLLFRSSARRREALWGRGERLPVA